MDTHAEDVLRYCRPQQHRRRNISIFITIKTIRSRTDGEKEFPWGNDPALLVRTEFGNPVLPADKSVAVESVCAGVVNQRPAVSTFSI
jgi:hypothetical protein